jgi:hypothetical protein
VTFFVAQIPDEHGASRDRGREDGWAEAAVAVHRESHGLVADEIYQVQEGS